MKNLLAYSLLCILFATACQPNKKKHKIPKTIKFIKTRIKNFSHPNKSDTFKVELTGNQSKNMSIIFSIKAFNGKEIYYEKLKAADLINNYKSTVDLSQEETKFNFLKQEVNLFFEEENFLEPAVTAEETADNHTADKDFYKELKMSGLNGFKYRLSTEKKLYIAWSENEKKVKIYYKCC